MQTLKSWLGSACSNKSRKAIKPSVRRTRMEVESLDDRLMPAVNIWMANGTLNIVGDNAANKIVVMPDLMNSNQIAVLDVNGNSMRSFPTAQVQRIELQGSGGDDVFNAMMVNIPCKMFGGDGNDVLVGSSTHDWFDGGNGWDQLLGLSGNDYFRGSSGWDSIQGGPGDDLVYRNGYSPIFDGGDGKDVVLGVNLAMNNSNLRLTPQELSQEGDFSVALSGNLLSLTGPTGIGLQLTGSWKAGSGAIISTGNVTMKTALGDIQVATPSTPIRIEMENAKWRGALADVPGYESYDNYGVLKTIHWTGMPISTTSGAFAQFSSQLGINVNVPGVTWGLKLGSDLENLDTPLNPAVPYFYVSMGSGFSASYGGLEASLGSGGNLLTVVADPTDPFLYVKVAEFAVAGSLKGQIPYDPWARPDGVTDQIYGNLYGSGSFDLQGIPVTLSGEVVVDLDANNDGVWVGLSNKTWKDIVRNPVSSANAVMTDIAFGVNGNVAVGYSKGGFNLSIPMADGSVMYTPGNFAFRGTSVNPFAGTALERFAPQNGFDFQGRIRDWGRDWNISARAYMNSFAGLSAADMRFSMGNNGIDLSGDVNVLMGIGRVSVRGWVRPNGDFGLSGQANFNLDIGIGQINAWANISFSQTAGTVRFNADMGADFRLGCDGFNIFGGMRLQVAATLGSSGFRFSGYGRAYLGVTVFGISGSVDMGFGISNDGFFIELPLTEKRLEVSW